MTDFNAMTDALVSCDAAKLTDLVNAALAADVPANEILNVGLIAGMDIVGERMENGDMFIPEVLRAAHATGAAPIAASLTGEVRVGLQFDGSVDFDGRLDEFAVWNTALNAAEIGALAGGAATQSILVPEPGSSLLVLLSGLMVIRRRR